MWLVRHGQSAGSVARDAAEAATLPVIDIATRDMDTPLSALGKQQAIALGHWFAQMNSAGHVAITSHRLTPAVRPVH